MAETKNRLDVAVVRLRASNQELRKQNDRYREALLKIIRMTHDASMHKIAEDALYAEEV